MGELRLVRPLVLCVLLSSTVVSAQIPNPPTGDPRFDAAVARAVKYLLPRVGKKEDDPEAPRHGYRILCAYACVKAGVKPNHDAIKTCVEIVKKQVKDGVYDLGDEQEQVYLAGVDAMFLAAADPDAKAELQAIANYLIKIQGAHGAWHYPTQTVGDVSMNQYGLLGLWACKKAGVNVPPTVWDRCAQWHVKNRSSDGGWAYHPGVLTGAGRGSSTHNMTLGATGSLAICRLMLFPSHAPGAKKKPKKKLFNILEEANTETAAGQKIKKPYDNYSPGVAIGSIEGSISSGLNWFNQRFTTIEPLKVHPTYYYYAMERSLALNRVKNVRGNDWYRVCGEELLNNQQEDGSFKDGPAPYQGTAFAILFYIRSTAQMIPQFGKGLQIGQRGFDLNNPNGKKKPRQLGPLDEMLARLEKINVQGIKDVPEEDISDLVAKVEQTPKKELIGQIGLLKKLVDHPKAQVRAVAIFALGRSGDVRIAPVLIDALYDNDVGVMREARTALCYVSRKPRGFGLPDDPAESVDGENQEVVDAAVSKWRTQALNRWRKWYLRIRPYDERGDLWGIDAAARTKIDD